MLAPRLSHTFISSPRILNGPITMTTRRGYALKISKLDANRICRSVMDPTPSIAAMTARIGLRLEDVSWIKEAFPTTSEVMPDDFETRAEQGI